MRLLPLLLFLVVGCSPKKKPEPAPPPSWILLQSSITERAEVEILPLGLTGAEPILGTKIDIPIAEKLYYNPNQGVLASGQGKEWVTAIEVRPGAWELRIHAVDAPDEIPGRVIPLEVEEVTSIFTVDHRILIGAGMRVGYVNVNSNKPAFVQLAQRRPQTSHWPAIFEKAYDLFARDGDLIVAIDDIQRPMYAELLKLSGEDEIEHLESWELPALVNGTYDLAEFSVENVANRDGTLYTVTPYDVMSGRGHDLMTLPIQKGKPPELNYVGRPVTPVATLGEWTPRPEPEPVPEPETTADEEPDDKPYVELGEEEEKEVTYPREEYIPWAVQYPTRTLAGTNVTGWTGMALLPGASPQIAIATGTRGLLLVPTPFTKETKPAVADLGGDCHDVIHLDGSIYGLVSAKGSGQLVELETGEGTATVVARHKLPGIYHRFLR